MQAATKVSHIVFMPYPARGHINPWHCTIASEVFPSNIRFATISNDVLPSAKPQAADTSAFFSAVKHMAAPFEHILDQLDPPVTTIITDNALAWAVKAGYSRNIPVGLAQMDEMVAGLKISGVQFLWVAREDTCRLQEDCRDLGLVVPWCHQLKVLNHSPVGGFLTHCGWNSIVDITFAGIQVLTFPFVGDQITESKQVVEDLKFGLRLKKEMGDKTLVTREEIAKTIQTLMNVDSSERKRLVKRAKQVQEICQAAMKKGGSSHTALDAFIQNILQGHAH
ncbi:hypothetical protein JRO89_XS08G0015000 [Xanthoceras sorbifolium]|uniref:Uncharacterized protein n=1 Tax=Xanthoceras sorbifolium TaxID=99658 RepID=A0ABQ8HND7_9ROSI|nr:hypothetical protein JRO89_XS08G0015000 [Xanthoceras sorbifolium]